MNILIMDNNSDILEEIRDLLGTSENLIIVGEVHGEQELFEIINENTPDMVLMDTEGLEINWLDIIRHITQQKPSVKILILIRYEDQTHVLKAIRAGITGYIAKKELASTLVKAVRVISQGGTYLYHSLTKKRIEQYILRPETSKTERLTPREEEIFKLVVAGYTSRKISEMISLPVKTVQNYRLRISKKLKTKNLASLIRYAINAGLMETDK